jgi:hypothetical protein
MLVSGFWFLVRFMVSAYSFADGSFVLFKSLVRRDKKAVAGVGPRRAHTGQLEMSDLLRKSFIRELTFRTK